MQASEFASESVPSNRQPNIAIVCLLGLCASLMTWGVLQWKYPFFTVSDEFSIGMGASNEARLALQNEQSRTNRLNSAIVLAVGGGLLAGFLAIFAQPCCAAMLRLLTALVGGLVWGGVSGFVGASLFTAMMPSDSLPSPTSIGLAQAVVFAMFGAGIGLLYGMFGRNRAAVLNGIGIGAIAGAVGGVLFPIVTGLVVPSQSTVEFIGSSAVVRLMWLVFPMVSIAAALPAFSAKMKR
jgi:hypothetical protein